MHTEGSGRYIAVLVEYPGQQPEIRFLGLEFQGTRPGDILKLGVPQSDSEASSNPQILRRAFYKEYFDIYGNLSQTT